MRSLAIHNVGRSITGVSTMERKKHIDISQWFRGPVFKPLKDSSFFKRFFIEAGTIAWPNGVDIAPEALYEAADVRKSNEKKKSRAKKN